MSTIRNLEDEVPSAVVGSERLNFISVACENELADERGFNRIRPSQNRAGRRSKLNYELKIRNTKKEIVIIGVN